MNNLLLETSTGRDWQRASLDARRQFCASIETYTMSPEALYQALETLLSGRAPSLADIPLAEAVSMITGAWPDSEGDPRRAT